MGQTNTLTVEKKTGQVRRLNIPVGMPKRGKRPLTEPRIASWSRAADGVGCIKISMFPGIVGIDVARDTDRAVRELDCSRLIVDLRANCGGGIGGLRLMSYLTPGKLPVGYRRSSMVGPCCWWRAGRTEMESRAKTGELSLLADSARV